MTNGGQSFFERPILNSPYELPGRHHPLDGDGQPIDGPPVDGRRKSELITPVPKPRKKKQKADKSQGKLDLASDDGLSTEQQEYNPTPIINEIRVHVDEWRRSNPAAWGVTPATARLLTHWRSQNFQGVRPFFCQVEAIETIIWLTEVARTKKQYSRIWEHVLGANAALAKYPRSAATCNLPSWANTRASRTASPATRRGKRRRGRLSLRKTASFM